MEFLFSNILKNHNFFYNGSRIEKKNEIKRNRKPRMYYKVNESYCEHCEHCALTCLKSSVKTRLMC